MKVLLRIPLLHLWLCTLLLFQQPSVRVQMGAWLQSPSRMELEDAPGSQGVEEAELPGLRSSERLRFKAEATRQWRYLPPYPCGLPEYEGVASPPDPEGRLAAWHWRTALLPPRVPPDDEPRGRG